MQNSHSTVSVVVSCRNEIKFIHGFLQSIFCQDLTGLDVEFLVADGGSDDGTRPILERAGQIFPILRVVENPENIVSTGLNAAIREARGEFIIRMDVRTEYAADYIRTCVQTIRETGADAAGGPALTRSEGYFADAIALALHTKFAGGAAKVHDPEFEGYVDTVSHGCWCRSTLDRIGLFDETLDHNQDDDLNFRIVSGGGKIWQSPKIGSWYRPRATLLGLFRQYFQFGFWKVVALRRHRKLASWRHLAAVAALVLCLLLLFSALATSLGGQTRLSTILVALWSSMAALYCGAALGSALAASRRKGWLFLPILPIVFATYHLGYASGLLLGLSYRQSRSDGGASRLRRVLAAMPR